MGDEEELVRHDVTPWTAGQLRDALTGLPADTPLKVNVSQDPGGGTAGEQVVIGASFGTIVWGGERGQQPDRVFGIDCEFRSGNHYRPRHAAGPRPGRQTKPGQ